VFPLFVAEPEVPTKRISDDPPAHDDDDCENDDPPHENGLGAGIGPPHRRCLVPEPRIPLVTILADPFGASKIPPWTPLNGSVPSIPDGVLRSCCHDWRRPFPCDDGRKFPAFHSARGRGYPLVEVAIAVRVVFAAVALLDLGHYIRCDGNSHRQNCPDPLLVPSHRCIWRKDIDR